MKKFGVLFLALMMAAMADLSLAQGAVAGGTTMAKPHTRTPVANKRMKRQKNRIKQGVKSGQITKDEATELKQDHKALRTEIKDAKKDGVVTKDERKQIQKDENTESKKIYDLKHNDQVQPKK